MIIGCFGFQRSGKTALSMLIARYFQKKGFDIYSNVEADDVNLICKISDIPIDYKSKVVIFDEAYFYLDSRDFKNNKDFTLFLNTLGKQKILLIVTAISPNQIDLRLRNQLKYIFLARGDEENIYYQVIDVTRSIRGPLLSIRKTKEFFDYLNYNSDLVVPNFIECDIKNFIGGYRNVSK